MSEDLEMDKVRLQLIFFSISSMKREKRFFFYGFGGSLPSRGMGLKKVYFETPSGGIAFATLSRRLLFTVAISGNEKKGSSKMDRRETFTILWEKNCTESS